MITYAEPTWRTCGETWHPVRVVQGGIPVHMFHWLMDHVGARGMAWIYPETHLICFRSHDHAVQFSLTWSGT